MRRRRFLKSAGALTVVVAAGQVGCFYGQDITDIKDGSEYEPWRTWRHDVHEGPLAFVRAAILASNTFNSQPWLFKVSKSRVELYADMTRNLGTFDPYLRDMHLSLGCALENLMLAAAAGGYRASLELMPGNLQPATEKPKPELVARVDFAPGEQIKSELYEAISHRHTSRDPFDVHRPLPSEFADALGRLAATEQESRMFLFTGDAERKKIAEIMDRAGATNLADPDVKRSLQPWFRTSEEQMRKLRDGALVLVDKSKPRPPGPIWTFCFPADCSALSPYAIGTSASRRSVLAVSGNDPTYWQPLGESLQDPKIVLLN